MNYNDSHTKQQQNNHNQQTKQLYNNNIMNHNNNNTQLYNIKRMINNNNNSSSQLQNNKNKWHFTWIFEQKSVKKLTLFKLILTSFLKFSFLLHYKKMIFRLKNVVINGTLNYPQQGHAMQWCTSRQKHFWTLQGWKQVFHQLFLGGRP